MREAKRSTGLSGEAGKNTWDFPHYGASEGALPTSLPCLGNSGVNKSASSPEAVKVKSDIMSLLRRPSNAPALSKQGAPCPVDALDPVP